MKIWREREREGETEIEWGRDTRTDRQTHKHTHERGGEEPKYLSYTLSNGKMSPDPLRRKSAPVIRTGLKHQLENGHMLVILTLNADRRYTGSL